jgi:hypothetical protein
MRSVKQAEKGFEKIHLLMQGTPVLRDEEELIVVLRNLIVIGGVQKMLA